MTGKHTLKLQRLVTSCNNSCESVCLSLYLLTVFGNFLSFFSLSITSRLPTRLLRSARKYCCVGLKSNLKVSQL